MNKQANDVSLPWIKLKDLVNNEEDTLTLAEEIIDSFDYKLSKGEEN